MAEEKMLDVDGLEMVIRTEEREWSQKVPREGFGVLLAWAWDSWVCKGQNTTIGLPLLGPIQVIAEVFNGRMYLYRRFAPLSYWVLGAYGLMPEEVEKAELVGFGGETMWEAWEAHQLRTGIKRLLFHAPGGSTLWLRTSRGERGQSVPFMRVGQVRQGDAPDAVTPPVALLDAGWVMAAHYPHV